MLDEKAAVKLAQDCRCILTVEEHSIYGGLGRAVAEVLAKNQPVPMDILGIPDEDVPNGSDSEVLELLGIGSKGICEQAKKLMERSTNISETIFSEGVGRR